MTDEYEGREQWFGLGNADAVAPDMDTFDDNDDNGTGSDKDGNY